MNSFTKFIKAIKQFDLVENNDSIAIGLSGGKDSLFLVDLFSQLQKTTMFDFKVCAIMVDMFNEKYKFDEIQKFCDSRNVTLHIIKTQIYDILFEYRQEKNPCSLCSKLRKGQLVTTAKELNCNKIALGHHADDLVETFFMSLMFEGRLSTFKPKTYLSRQDITQIRPMIYISEDSIIKYTKDFPIFVNPCPADKHTKREEVKKAINEIEKISNKFREYTLKAILDETRHQNFFENR